MHLVASQHPERDGRRGIMGNVGSSFSGACLENNNDKKKHIKRKHPPRQQPAAHAVI